ncbi:nuclease-related domain-containing protein [Sporosarcina aquimarina]|uniref:Nuclease-related domain-containing protein n=1 Tax=Sporosarcina aquimarina TaxID=114975 RepID=A0ABU4FVL7_9BACL|nr:nuclease-related domain-containing protein [Sporosarcina aquimarina]
MTIIILKERTPPLLIEGLESALRRLSPNHPAIPKIQARLSSIKAGFGGEEELDRVLRDYNFPANTWILNDLSLSSRTLFQIDTLLLTPEFAVICEVKNISGELTVKENPPQLLRVADDGTITGFISPLAQVENTCSLFKDWLLSQQIDIPVYGCVVLAYAKQRITIPPTHIPILFPRLVPNYVRSLHADSPKLTSNELRQLTTSLINAHRDYLPDSICSIFDITTDSIKKGVACPSCEQIGMRKRGKGWFCTSCGTRSNDAHIQAIRDWFMLFNKPLTNTCCRSFLGVKNPRTALNLMTTMELTANGNNRGRTYTLKLNKRRQKHT